jgi:hypothetical protein
MKTQRLVFTCFFAGLFSLGVLTGCSDDPVGLGNDETDSVIYKESVNGVAQKGPFVRGSNVILYELDSEDFSQTGRSFNTTIKDDAGNFTIEDIQLAGPFAKLRADGYYFNEITGGMSASQLTMHAMANLADESTVNINVLSHLKTPRIQNLVSEGMPFADARDQARSEVLSVFHIDQSEEVPAGQLNIAEFGEDNAALLAISSLLQGYRSGAELTVLLNDMREDLSENGELNDAELGSQLVNHAVYLRPALIRKHLEERYSAIGTSAEVPDFEHHITKFLEQTSFEITQRLIEYPEYGIHGDNILDPDRTNYVRENASLAAEPAEGTALRVRISDATESGRFAESGMWVYYILDPDPINWSVTTYDHEINQQEFTVKESGRSSDLRIRFTPGHYLIEYFEIDTEADEPTFSKEIFVEN